MPARLWPPRHSSSASARRRLRGRSGAGGLSRIDGEGIVHRVAGHASAGQAAVEPEPPVPRRPDHDQHRSSRPIFWGAGVEQPRRQDHAASTSSVQRLRRLELHEDEHRVHGHERPGRRPRSPYGAAVVDTSAGPSNDPRTNAVIAEVAKMISEPGRQRLLPGLHRREAWQRRVLRLAQLRDGQRRSRPGRLLLQPRRRPGLRSGRHRRPPTRRVSRRWPTSAATSSARRSPTRATAAGGTGAAPRTRDKCAWTFSGTVTLGGEQWKIQGNWSNAANNAHSGYDKAGCIQTK